MAQRKGEERETGGRETLMVENGVRRTTTVFLKCRNIKNDKGGGWGKRNEFNGSEGFYRSREGFRGSNRGRVVVKHNNGPNRRGGKATTLGTIREALTPEGLEKSKSYWGQ